MMIKRTLIFFLIAFSQITMAQERLVTVNKIRYNVWQKGFEKRKPGTPAIIMESGMGTDLHHWDPVLTALADVAPVFAYDRAGIGQSEKIYQLPTFNLVAGNLRKILEQLRIDPPYILVGHSLGGVYVRAFAGLYPGSVAGLVFIDPADFTETKSDWRHLLSSLGIPSERVEEMLFERLYKTNPPDSTNYGGWNEGVALTELRKTDFAELNSLPLPPAPVVFFLAGKFEVPPERWSKDFHQPDFFKARSEANLIRWRKFIDYCPRGGSLIYVSTAGHFVHRDEPKTVLSTIRLLLDSVR